MSTRSAIVAKVGDKYHGIYCHNDGYLEGVGKTLLEHYADRAKVEELIALGDISCLGEVIGEKHDFDWQTKVFVENAYDWSKVAADPRYKYTRTYHRDRGETLNVAKGDTWKWVAKEIGHNGYVFVFGDDSVWRVSREYIVSGDLAELELLSAALGVPANQ